MKDAKNQTESFVTNFICFIGI